MLESEAWGNSKWCISVLFYSGASLGFACATWRRGRVRECTHASCGCPFDGTCLYRVCECSALLVLQCSVRASRAFVCMCERCVFEIEQCVAKTSVCCAFAEPRWLLILIRFVRSVARHAQVTPWPATGRGTLWKWKMFKLLLAPATILRLQRSRLGQRVWHPLRRVQRQETAQGALLSMRMMTTSISELQARQSHQLTFTGCS
jgi:hypothetical protein